MSCLTPEVTPNKGEVHIKEVVGEEVIIEDKVDLGEMGQEVISLMDPQIQVIMGHREVVISLLMGQEMGVISLLMHREEEGEIQEEIQEEIQGGIQHLGEMGIAVTLQMTDSAHGGKPTQHSQEG